MELNANLWHVRLYFWGLEVWDAFRDSYSPRYRSNLCHYIRIIFVWMPLALASNIAVWLYAYVVLIHYPLTYFGVEGAVGIYVTLALFVGAIVLFLYVRKRLKQRQLVEVIPQQRRYGEEGGHGPGLLEIIWLYLVAAKRKICPTIEFRRNSHLEGM